MWYYKNGKLVVETDVVTGNYGTNDTPKGAYSIIYKASPATLMLNSHVTFWLPFTSDGCGIHDASWRASWEYGGTRYTQLRKSITTFPQEPVLLFIDFYP